MNILIPMAGRGERFSSVGYNLPKPLIEIDGKPMIEWALRSLDIDFHSNNFIFIVRDYKNEKVDQKLAEVLKSLVPNNTTVKIDYVTEGPACTCLLAHDLINSDVPLVIANCDQIMKWSGSYFVNSCLNSSYDGIVVTYEENTPKNSYAKLNCCGDVIRIEEKNVISNISLNGIHFWKCGSDFISSAKMMIKKNERYNNEFYVGPSYNYMIESGKRVGIFHIPRECHNPVGVPNDVGIFLEKLK